MAKWMVTWLTPSSNPEWSMHGDELEGRWCRQGRWWLPCSRLQSLRPTYLLMLKPVLMLPNQWKYTMDRIIIDCPLMYCVL
jgi:hypothetical protein